jgi:hypothetical protein
MALAQWLLQHVREPADPLAARLATLGLELLEELTLALKGWERELRIDDCDERLIRLRTLLRLAAESGRFTTEQYAHVLERVDAIGRQLGAWRRSLQAQ